MDTQVKPAYDAEYFVRAPLSRFEKPVSCILGRALLAHRFLQPLDLGGQQRDALGEFLDRQQIQVLPDLMGDLLSRLVVILGGHEPCSCTSVWLIRCSRDREEFLRRSDPVLLFEFWIASSQALLAMTAPHRKKSWKSCPRK